MTKPVRSTLAILIMYIVVVGLIMAILVSGGAPILSTFLCINACIFVSIGIVGLMVVLIEWVN